MSTQQLIADQGQRREAVDVVRELPDIGPADARKAPGDLLQIQRFLRFARAIELPFQLVGQHAVDDQRADVHSGGGQQFRGAGGFLDCQPLGNRDEHERRAAAVEHAVAQQLQPLLAALERRQHGIRGTGSRPAFLTLGTAIDLEQRAAMLHERPDPGVHHLGHA